MGMMKNKKGIYVLFVIITVAQLAFIIYTFQFKKEGCHSDELWSYGYANSYYLPSIYLYPDRSDKILEKWNNSEALWDYLVVNDGEQFTYDSVYSNQINDLSPPLHSMLLHTICSFFPNQFSLWYSFIINIGAFLVAMLFLFRCCTLLKSERMALLICTIYGFSLGAIENFIYLRMYAMCTALLMIILYCFLTIVKAQKGDKIYISLLILFTTAVEAFLTHYYMISIGGILTFLFCLYLLFSKRIKHMLQLGFTMLFALLSSIAIFPSLLQSSKNQTVQISGNNMYKLNANLNTNFRILLNFITEKEIGASIPLNNSSYFWLVMRYIFCAFLLSLPFVYLFRKKLNKINWIYIILFISCLLQIGVVAATSDVYGMGYYADRYLFFINPIFIMIIILFVYSFIKVCFRKYKTRQILAIILAFCLFINNVRVITKGSFYYFPTKREGISIEEAAKGRNVVFLDFNSWFLTAMTEKLMYSKEYFMTNIVNYQIFRDAYLEKMQEGEMILIVNTLYFDSASEDGDASGGEASQDDTGIDNEEGKADDYTALLQFFEDLEPNSEMELLSKEQVFRRPMEVYLINP